VVDVLRFDLHQPRDPGGEDGGQWVSTPSLPDLDMEGFSLISRAEGSFGTLEMGVDDVGDVRLAFHEGSEARALDLGNNEVADLRDILERLAVARDDLDDDAESDWVYDDYRFGYGDAHKVELYGNGLISVAFFADDDDPYMLNLDPPYEADPEDEGSDDVQGVLDAIDDVLNEVDAKRSSTGGELRKYNPSQPRDPGGEDGGQWVSRPAGAASAALKDVLKLAGKIDLEPDEKLVGSDKADGRAGAIRIAMTERGDEKSVRLGLGGDRFAGRYDESGPWRAGPDKTTALNAERKKLRDEQDALNAEWDHADPARRAAIEARLNEIDEMKTDDVYPAGYTAKLGLPALERLRSTLSDAIAAGAKLQAELDDDREPDRPTEGYWTLAQGSIPGEWADVHYNVYLDDPSVGVEVYLGAVPHGSGLDFDDLTGNEQAASLDPDEMKKVLRLFDKYVG
jgi:hypothetical protein